jgi:hypothetical protein
MGSKRRANPKKGLRAVLGLTDDVPPREFERYVTILLAHCSVEDLRVINTALDAEAARRIHLKELIDANNNDYIDATVIEVTGTGNPIQISDGRIIEDDHG